MSRPFPRAPRACRIFRTNSSLPTAIPRVQASFRLHFSDRSASSCHSRARQTLLRYEAGPLAGAISWTPQTGPTLHRLTDLEPRRLAVMHGSRFVGDGGSALRDLAGMLVEILGPVPLQPSTE